MRELGKRETARYERMGKIEKERERLRDIREWGR